MLPAGNRTDTVMAVMADGAHLRSKSGLRSLSKTAPGGGPDLIYGTQVMLCAPNELNCLPTGTNDAMVARTPCLDGRVVPATSKSYKT